MTPTATPCGWTDEEQRYREIIEYTSAGVFSVTVFPFVEPVAGAVMHASMFEDMRRNYRREVLLARRLARAGFVVQRYHARGTGNSVGEPGEVRWDNVVEDGAEAEACVRGHLGEHRPVSIYGAGFGALVAVALAAGRPNVPLVLWDPVPDANAYGRELRRNELIANLADGYTVERGDPLTSTDRLPPDIAARADELSLSALGADGLGPVHVSRRGRERSAGATTSANDALRQCARSFAAHTYSDEPAPWSGMNITERAATAKWSLLDDTVTWLSSQSKKTNA